jgi:hypothetical protein
MAYEAGSFSSGSLPSLSGPGPGGAYTPWGSNTENNLALPQGSQTSTALPSSISSTITGLLYQSRQKPANYWGNFFSGGWNQDPRATPWQAPGQTPAPNTPATPAKPTGATTGRYTTGGTIKLKDGKYYTVLGYTSNIPSGFENKKTYTVKGSDGKSYRVTLGPNNGKTNVTPPKPESASKGSTGKDANSPGMQQPGFGYSGGIGMTGQAPIYGGMPMQGHTMQALQVADAYFSPKRLELAYELEQMDTDMRRLAVNLGRQIDDPILQAKLYKEAMKQTRTLDNDQSVFALQMVEQRRKEEMANRQFYDQLGLEADKVRAASQQFFASLNMTRGQTELANQQFYAGLGLQMGQTQLANQQYYAGLGMQMGQTQLANQQYYAGLGMQQGQTQMANQQYYAGLSAQSGWGV